MKWGLFLAGALLCGSSVAAKPVKIVRDSKALEFTYEWSSEAAAVPALDRRFRVDMEKQFREAQRYAREDQKVARQQKREFNGHYYSMSWTTAGQTARLLSLQSDNGTFSGGAHPNSSYGAMLWDRRLGRAVNVSALFVSPGGLQAVTRGAYCKALAAERLKRREGERLGGQFDECPALSELAIAPVDANRNGRFDRIAFVASPYVAGPYVEGEYELLLPVTSRLMAALKPEYRSSFEAQRQ